MGAKAEDRRVQRTRTLLLDALLDLIAEKGYAAVTVQDIVDRANVGRSTFYAHFLDKRELLLSGVNGLLMFLAQQGTGAAPSDESCTRLLGFSLPLFSAHPAQLQVLPSTDQHPKRHDCGTTHPTDIG